MMKVIVFDIDGTLANAQHRLHYIKTKPKDWDAFFDAQKDDKPFPHVVATLLAFRALERYPIIFSSGRPEKYREMTMHWLERHGLFNPFIDKVIKLYMRPDGDRRDDDIVKREILGKMWMDGYEPIMAFDDRDRVVKMWRDNGVPCFQVAPGDF